MMDRALLEQLQQTAHIAAFRAGQVIREQNDQPRKVKMKGPRDLLTDTDTAAQFAALTVIVERHPDHRLLAEEDPASHPDDQGVWHIPAGVVWIVDPLDGTSNYAAGLPVVCVSVGAALDGEPVVGAIYDPLRQEFFEGARGLGATLNGRPLPPLNHTPLEDSLVSLDWAREPDLRKRAVAAVTALAPACRTLRALGSAALGLAYLAAGRTQVYFHFGLQPWDVAAGAALIREVGGDLRRPDGEPWRLGDPALLAGHPALLDEVMPLMQGIER